jgi:hypothetical protein
MNYPFNQNNDLADSVRLGKVITHCAHCGEIVSSLNYMSYGDEAWSGYADSGLECCYCPNCDLFWEGWFRSNEGSAPELCAIGWKKSAESGRWETDDTIFGSPVNPSRGEFVERCFSDDDMCCVHLIIIARHYRALSGPRFVEDDDKCTVGIPIGTRSADEAQALLSGITRILKKKRIECTVATEIAEQTFWIHLADANALYHVTGMWEVGDLPEDVTFWCYNVGRPYRHIPWDYSNRCPSVHPSHGGQVISHEREPKVPKLARDATLVEAVAWLDARLGEIDEQQPELDDTRNRDELFTFVENFLHGNTEEDGYSFWLDDKNAQRRLMAVLKTFSKHALPLAASEPLDAEQRKQLILDVDGYLVDFVE